MSRSRVELNATAIDEMAWQPFPGGPSGMLVKCLSGQWPGGNHTRLIKADPGLRIDEVRAHPFLEETYVLEGGFFDRGNFFGAGSYTCYPPGHPHGPFRTTTGWIALEVVSYDESPTAEVDA